MVEETKPTEETKPPEAPEKKEEPKVDEAKKDVSKKELAVVQVALKNLNKITGYTGTTDGSPDPAVQESIPKALSYIKEKLPDDSAAQSLSFSVGADGSVNGSAASFIGLLNKSNRIAMYKLFAPYAGGKPITNEPELKAAIEAAKSSIRAAFSGTSVDVEKILKEFDTAVSSNQIDQLSKAISLLSSFKKSTPGSGAETAVKQAIKHINQITKVG